MPVTSGIFRSSSLAKTLKTLVSSNKTGYLRIKEADQEGVLVLENGIILNARIGSTVALPALFQFVSWREVSFEFLEKPVAADVSRDLAVYEPQVLIEGLAFKEEELSLLHQALPPFEAVPYYKGGGAPASIEATPADMGLLTLADGHRTVREISDMVKLSPLEVARTLARFRLAGVLEIRGPKKMLSKAALAALL